MNNSTCDNVICNKCGLEVKVEETQSSVLLQGSMHKFDTFYTEFEHCGQDTNLDMQTCKFTMCQSCLLKLFDTFKVPVVYEDNKEWDVDTYNDGKLSNMSDEEIKVYDELANEIINANKKKRGYIVDKFNKGMFIRSMLEFLIGYSIFGIFLILIHVLNSSMFVYCFGSFEIFYMILAICISTLRAKN